MIILKKILLKKIGYASGTCLFTSKKVLKQVGLLDPFLFLYHDDLDLGWRAAQIGIGSYYVPNSVIYHVESYALKWNAKKILLVRKKQEILYSNSLFKKNICENITIPNTSRFFCLAILFIKRISWLENKG